MKCEKCGNIIEDNYIWCPVCGKKKPKSNKNIDIDEKITCSYCGINIKPDSIYCFNCGKKVKKHLLKENTCYYICLLNMMCSLICLSLFIFILALIDIYLGIFLFFLGIVTNIASIVINIYAIVCYPRNRYFKRLIVINILDMLFNFFL